MCMTKNPVQFQIWKNCPQENGRSNKKQITIFIVSETSDKGEMPNARRGLPIQQKHGILFKFQSICSSIRDYGHCIMSVKSGHPE